jgi:hypothetical protein
MPYRGPAVEPIDGAGQSFRPPPCAGDFRAGQATAIPAPLAGTTHDSPAAHANAAP